MKLINFVYIIIVLIVYPLSLQAQNSCSKPIEKIENQTIAPEKTLGQYYRDRKRGLLYGYEKPLKEAIKYFQSKKNKEKQFQSLMALTDYYILTQNIQNAQRMFFQSEELAQQENNPEWKAIARMLWANTELYKERDDRFSGDPISVYQQALKFAKEHNDSKLQKTSLLELQLEVNILQAKFILNKEKTLQITKSDFEYVFKQIILFHRIYGNYYLSEVAKQAIIFGFLTIHSADSDIQLLGKEALIKARDWLKEIPEDELYADAYGYLGEFYLKDKNFKLAETHLYNAAFFARQQNKSITLLYYWYWQLAKLNLQQGNIEQAKKFYKMAVKYLKTVRRSIFTTFPSSQLKILPKDDNLFKEYADLLFKQAEQLGEGVQKQKILFEALNAMEQFQAVKLQNYFEDECIADLHTEINTKTLPKILSKTETAAFYPIIFEDRIVLLLVRMYGQSNKRMIHLAQTVVHQDKINSILADNKVHLLKITNVHELLGEYIKILTKKEFLGQFHDTLWFYGHYMRVNKALYQLFIEPILENIRGIKTLIIIPTEKLSTIPFAGLHNGDENELIRDYAIVSAVNLSLIIPSHLPRLDQSFLFAGLSKEMKGYQPLPGVKLLFKHLGKRKFYNMSAKSFLDEQFAYDNISDSIDSLTSSTYGIMHIATHGEFNATPSGRFLVAPDNILMDDLEDMLSGKVYKKPLNLLVLSACNTATGDENAVLGLAGVAVKSRTSSVLGSLWAVKEDTTAKLMQDFYDNLLEQSQKTGSKIDSKAIAWQQTQIKYLDNAKQQTQKNPYYWAGFILIGSQ